MKLLVIVFAFVGVLQTLQTWGATSQGICSVLVDPDEAPTICKESRSSTSYFDDTMVDGCFWIGANRKPFDVEAYVSIEKFKNKVFSEDATSKSIKPKCEMSLSNVFRKMLKKFQA